MGEGIFEQGDTEALRAEIDAAYARLGEATTDLAHSLTMYDRRVRDLRVEHAEELLEAKNERSAALYLEGIFERDRTHRDVEDRKIKAELEHKLAKQEVERLHLIVRLLATPPATGAKADG